MTTNTQKQLTINNKHWLLPILSGIFIGTSYIPFPPWASLFCFVPLWLFWQQQEKLKNVFLGGLLTAFIFTLIGFNWVAHTLHVYVPVTGLIWFVAQHKLKCPKHLSIPLMALITVICEANSYTLFDWNFGYSWYGANLPIYQWAEFVGFSGLSALTLLCNLPLYYAWQQRQQKSGKTILMVVASIFIILNIVGLGLKARLEKPDSTLTTLLVQASIENSEKMAAELGKGYSREILNRYMNLTEQAIHTNPEKKIDFALWPETAFPALLGEQFKNNTLPLALSSFLKRQNMALITGAYSVEAKTNLITNSLFVLNNAGELVAPHYSKTILLAFGEFIPGEHYFPQIRDWLPETGHFARGQGPNELLKLNDFMMGAQICYESLFPAFARSLAQLNAQFIVNVTNDSWYGNWQEPYQHLYMTLARGVEFRRPILRVTNTGISTVSLASGDILTLSPIHEPWAGIYEVPYLKNPPATFYQTWFWLLPGIIWGTLMSLCGYLLIRQYNNQ